MQKREPVRRRASAFSLVQIYSLVKEPASRELYAAYRALRDVRLRENFLPSSSFRSREDEAECEDIGAAYSSLLCFSDFASLISLAHVHSVVTN